MTAQAVMFALSAGFLLSAAGVSLFCLWRAGVLLQTQRPSPISETAVELLQQKLDALEQEVQDLRRHGPPASVPAPPRAGFNLEKRSHALRMHRRGEPVSQIATVLELPQQEVELLIKVHRIVLRNL